MELSTLNAKSRSLSSKSDLKGLRAAGQVPAVYYGKGTEPVLVSVDAKEFSKIWGPGTRNTVFGLTIEGQEGQVACLAYDVQRDIITQEILHIDFIVVKEDEKVKVNVPVKLVGVAKGVKAQGGRLFQNSKSIRIKTLPGNIPSVIEYDVTEVEAKQTRYVRDLEIGEAELVTTPRAVVFSIGKGRAS